jgi:biotin transport system substrate-specific component
MLGSPSPATSQRLGPPAVLRLGLLVLAGTALLTLSAKTQVPFWPVPMTLQTAVVMLLGVSLGWRLAAASVLLYLAQGMMGLPVFAGPLAGPAYFAGPTGGYLLGFVAGAVVAGFAAERSRGIVGLLLGLVGATAAIYLCGVAWLATFTGLSGALQAGVLPFLLGDAVKIGLVAALAAAGLRLRRAA